MYSSGIRVFFRYTAIILQVYVYSYIYNKDTAVTKAQMHIHAPVVLGIATGTAWTFGIFVVSIESTLNMELHATSE